MLLLDLPGVVDGLLCYVLNSVIFSGDFTVLGLKRYDFAVLGLKLIILDCCYICSGVFSKVNDFSGIGDSCDLMDFMGPGRNSLWA